MTTATTVTPVTTAKTVTTGTPGKTVTTITAATTVKSVTTDKIDNSGNIDKGDNSDISDNSQVTTVRIVTRCCGSVYLGVVLQTYCLPSKEDCALYCSMQKSIPQSACFLFYL